MSEQVLEVQGEDVLPENKGEIAVVINPADFGMAVEKAAVIESSFMELSVERESLRAEYAQVIKQPKTLTSCKQAKELSRRVGKNRTKTVATYKVEKEVYLRGSQYIDALRNRDVQINSNMEEELNEFAQHFEKIEADRLIQLAADRDTELRLYTDVVPAALGTMMDDVYNFYLTSAKKAFEDKAELDRLADERRVIDELDKSRRILLADYWAFVLEEDRLTNFGQLEAEKFDLYLTTIEQAKAKKDEEDAAEVVRLAEIAAQEKIAATKKQAELQKKIDADKVIADRKEAELVIERKAAADLLKKQQDDAAETLRISKEKADAILLAEKTKKLADDKIAADLLAAEKIKTDKLKADLAKIEADKVAAKEIADAKIVSDKIAADKLLSAPRKEKLTTWVDGFKMTTPTGAESDIIALDIISKFDGFKKWANDQINKL